MNKRENNYTEADYYSKNIEIGFEPYRYYILDNTYHTAGQTASGYLYANRDWGDIRGNIPGNALAPLDQRYEFGRSHKASTGNNNCFGTLPRWMGGGYTISPGNLKPISKWITDNIILRLDQQSISTDLILLKIARGMLVKLSQTRPSCYCCRKSAVPTEQQISELNLQLLDNWLRAKREWNTFCYAKQVAGLPF